MSRGHGHTQRRILEILHELKRHDTSLWIQANRIDVYKTNRNEALRSLRKQKLINTIRFGRNRSSLVQANPGHPPHPAARYIPTTVQIGEQHIDVYRAVIPAPGTIPFWLADPQDAATARVPRPRRSRNHADTARRKAS